MKKTFWIIVAVLLASGGAMIGYRIYQKSLEQAGAIEQKKKKSDAVAVEAVSPRVSNLRDRRMFSGSLRPWSTYNVSPKVSGRLLRLPFTIGDAIKPGELIAQLDDTEYRQQQNQAAADLEVANAQLKEAEVVLSLRQQEFDRQETLLNKQIGSRAQFESAQTALSVQKAAVVMKQAEVKRAEAVLENARIKLSDTTIRADWPQNKPPRFVGERFVDEGALLQVNQPIVSILEIDRLKAAINVIERDYPFLSVGQQAEVTTDAYPGKTFRGEVAKISKLLAENSRQATVLLEIPNPEFELKPGMFVRVHLEFARRENATVVPRSAVVKRNGKFGVFRLSPGDGKAFFTEVQTGIVVDDMVEIITEPPLTSPVITLGNHLLTHGAEVIVPDEFKTASPAVSIQENRTPAVKK